MFATQNKNDILQEIKHHEEVVARYNVKELLPEHAFLTYNNSRKVLSILRKLLDDYCNEQSK